VQLGIGAYLFLNIFLKRRRGVQLCIGAYLFFAI